MLEEIKKSLRSANVDTVLSAFLNENQQPIPRELKDIRKKFMEKYKKTKYTKEFDTPIDRCLTNLKEEGILKKKGKTYTVNKNYFEIIKKANDIELLNPYNEENTIFLPNISLYGVNKKIIGKSEIKVLQSIQKKTQKEIEKLELAQTKLRLANIQKEYSKKLKETKDKNLKILLKKYSKGILKDSSIYHLSDNNLKKHIIQIQLFKKRGKKFYPVSISKQEKEKLADFCIEVRKEAYKKFHPSNIILMYKTSKRNLIKDILPVLT